MSIPRNHHYLPQWYVRRWETDGRVWAFTRPRGLDQPLLRRRLVPKAIGYERDLYALRSVTDAATRQHFEMTFLQRIDDDAARVVTKIENRVALDLNDFASMSQFALSLLYRSPMQIERVLQNLKSRVSLEAREQNALLRDQVIDLIGTSVSSPDLNHAIMDMKAHFIDLGPTNLRFVLSDAPVLMSKGIKVADAFLVLPLSPTCLLALVHNEEIVANFASYPPRLLASSINDAVVRQADHLVVATSSRPTRMIEKAFQRSDGSLDHRRDELNGFVSWMPPGPFADSG